MNFIILFISLILTLNGFVDSQYIDPSDMTDARIMGNRLKYVSGSLKEPIVHKPKNPFPDLSSCEQRLKVKKIGNSNRLEGRKNEESNRLMGTNRLEDLNRLEDGTNKLNELAHADDLSYDDELADLNESDESMYLSCVSSKFNDQLRLSKEDQKKMNELSDDGQLRKTYDGLLELYNSCTRQHKNLTEELVCFRNLKKLFDKNQKKIHGIMTKLEYNDHNLQLHSFTHEFVLLTRVLNTKNCLLAIDHLEELFDNLDYLVYRKEPIDYSKPLIFVSIAIPLLYFVYYIYKSWKVKYFVIVTLCLIAYAHEYYYLLIAKKAEMQYELRKFIACEEATYASNIFTYFFFKLFSPLSFRKDDCDINEDYLYIDAVFKINPFLPVFTIVPKLFTESIRIVFNNVAIAFNQFASHLPLFHVYPFLLIFLAVIIFIIKLFFDWNVESRKVDADYRLKLTKLTAMKEIPMLSKRSLNNRISGDSLDNSFDNILNCPKSRILKRSTSLDFIPNF